MLPVIPREVAATQRYRRSCWDFLAECVFTLDQADKEQPVKVHPANPASEFHEDMAPYLRHVVRRIVDEHEPLVALVKSRRMMATWTICAIFCWDVLFREGRQLALVSKKEKDSDDLVQRVKFVYDNIPSDKLPLKPPARYKYCEFAIPEIDSRVLGVASGKDQLRQYTCSRVLCDEMAFWEDAAETYGGLKPTLDGGGQAILVSTRYPGFFKDLIEDKFGGLAA